MMHHATGAYGDTEVPEVTTNESRLRRARVMLQVRPCIVYLHLHCAYRHCLFKRELYKHFIYQRYYLPNILSTKHTP
jgi:hypothetical protein